MPITVEARDKFIEIEYRVTNLKTNTAMITENKMLHDFIFVVELCHNLILEAELKPCE